jgi:hypothetical protein
MDADNGKHILFAKEARYLQLELWGSFDPPTLRLMTPAVFPSEQIRVRLRTVERLADLVQHRALRSALYPPASRGPRFARILQIVDGWLGGATQRDIAVAIFGVHRVDQDWSDPRCHLRDHIRRAIARGRDLMNGGYLRLLQ